MIHAGLCGLETRLDMRYSLDEVTMGQDLDDYFGFALYKWKTGEQDFMVSRSALDIWQ